MPALDGWRGVSILLVLAAHAGVGPLVPGGLGVTIFFFVSGLLITGQLLDEHRLRGRIDLARFYKRRALRLLPASTAFVVIAGLVFIACGGAMRPAAWPAALLYGANYAQLTSHVFDTNVSGLVHPFVILWSLAIEEQFYLVWPVLLLVLARLGGRTAMMTGLAFCILGCLVWRCHLAPICEAWGPTCGPHGDDWISKSTDTRADSLAFGAFAAVLLRARAAASVTAAARMPAAIAGAALLLVTVAIRSQEFRDTWRYTLQGAALLVLVTASLQPGPLAALLSRPLPMAIGRLSYGLYLWHWLALMIAGRVAPAGPTFDAIFASLTLAFTFACWFGIERPMVALRRRAGSQATAALLQAGADRRTVADPALAG